MLAVKNTIEQFSYSNIPQTYPNYDPLKPYTLIEDTEAQTEDSIAKVGNYYYRSVINNNIGNEPASSIGIQWIAYRYSNQSAMLDTSSLSSSVIEGDDLIVEFVRGMKTTLAIGNFEASSLKVEHLDSLGVVIAEFTNTITYSINENVFDYYDYIYEDYSTVVDRGVYLNIPPIGETIRVTFGKVVSTDRASCGFFVAGESIYMGDTLDEVSFSFNSFAVKEKDEFGTLNIINRNIEELVDFDTVIDTSTIMQTKRDLKSIYNDVVVFILDPSEDSKYENLLGLGVIQDASVVGRFSSTKSMMTFSIFESI